MSVTVIDHPLIQHKLAVMRDRDTNVRDFRALCTEVSMLMAFDAMRDLQLEEDEVETPVALAKVRRLAGKKLALVAILRAGLVMVDGILSMVPTARVGHIGLYRDPETLKPVRYYTKVPNDIAERDTFLLDPMLATGGSAVAAIDLLKEQGATAIRLLCIIGAPEGIAVVERAHPDVSIILAQRDDHLNDHGYIVPGLGDAGDRIYGTR
ncbi:MAG TPA: uracil phosphoribosyltransferase [Trueperaceae bacterium]|nr:uracil phosphoribosyltransferase [Trueperaceae bacterium]